MTRDLTTWLEMSAPEHDAFLKKLSPLPAADVIAASLSPEHAAGGTYSTASAAVVALNTESAQPAVAHITPAMA